MRKEAHERTSLIVNIASRSQNVKPGKTASSHILFCYDSLLLLAG
jgi:hypothetical protein